MIFCYSESFPLGKGWGPLFEQTWIPFTQGYFVPSLVEIGPVILMKKIFQNFVIISTWKRAGPFIWTSPNNALYQVWLKLARGSEEHFFKFVNVFSLFCYIPLEGGALQGCFVPSLVEIGLFWRRRRKCEKFTTTATPPPLTALTDNGQIVIRIAHLSLWLGWAKDV